MPKDLTVTPVPTPESIPVPGAGSWRWSDTAPHWVPNTPAEDTPAESPKE